MFFISAIVSLLGALAFWVIVYDYPKDHPWISATEREAIESALAKDRVTYDSQKRDVQRLSFKAAAAILFKNRIFWAICGAAFFVQMIYVTNFSWLPSYLVLERGFSNVKSGNALSLPYLAAAFGALSGGIISDRLGSRTLVMMLGAVLTIPAIAGLLVLDNETAVLTMIALVLFCNAAAVSLFVVLIFDLFPPEVTGIALAVTLGICGGLGAAAGPVILGYAYDKTHSFAWGFIVMAIGMAVSLTLLSFVFIHERRMRREKQRKAAAAGELAAA
jgi:sugar phosphate permease